MQSGATGQQSPLPQQVKPSTQSTERAIHNPPSHRLPVQGSEETPQSASVAQVLIPGSGQQVPLPQHVYPGAQSTMKTAQVPSLQVAPVQGSTMPSRQS